MKRSLVIPLYVLLVFLSGAMVGVVSYRLYSAKTVIATQSNTQPKIKPEEWRKHVVEDMRTRLKLSDEQVGKLQGAFDSTRQRFAAYDQRNKAERKSIIEDQHQTIRSFLDDQQRAEYDKYLLERQQKRRNEEKKKHDSQ
jgi:uncharacterized membrane protein